MRRNEERSVQEMNVQEQSGFCRFLIPQYDEIVLFTMGFTCVLLLVTGALSANYQEIALVPPHEYDPRIVVAGGIFIAGLALSL